MAIAIVATAIGIGVGYQLWAVEAERESEHHARRRLRRPTFTRPVGRIADAEEHDGDGHDTWGLEAQVGAKRTADTLERPRPLPPASLSFDSRRAAVLRFDDADRLLGAELIEDPAEVAKHCRWRDLAWRYATGWRRYYES